MPISSLARTSPSNLISSFRPVILIAAAVVAGSAASATASIIGTTGAATLIARPANAQLNVLQSNTQAFVWNEAQGVTLTSPVVFNASAPGTYLSASSFVTGNLPTGTLANSHYISFDTVGGSSQVANGTVTFNANIIGVIAWNRPGSRDLDGSDAQFGLGTLFTINNDRRGVFDVDAGTAVPQDDSFTISADRRTLTFSLQVSSPFDQIRVVTAIPSPSAAALLGLGGLLAARRRR